MLPFLICHIFPFTLTSFYLIHSLYKSVFKIIPCLILFFTNEGHQCYLIHPVLSRPYSPYNPQYLVQTAPNTTKYHTKKARTLVTHEILYGVMRKKFLKFTVKLGRQCLVMGNDQRRLV